MGDEEVIIDENGHTDDEYEVLVKALGAYNQGATKFNNSLSWSEILTDSKTMEDAKLVKAIRYGLDILKDIEKPHVVRTDHGIRLPLRTYIWKGGTYPANLTDENGNSDPKAGTEWCFEYGEEEWLAGGKIMGDDGKLRDKVFSDYQDVADFDVDQRVDCQ
ncbi:hypothetical protein [Oceaniserpentilla sp. 4NH20-0058]|uniref:hypothetical protein n=1 Tax=Oceaniserpentilla sp. 4NH20-0058 TaxID=3127660 RepID=UPI0033421193